MFTNGNSIGFGTSCIVVRYMCTSARLISRLLRVRTHFDQHTPAIGVSEIVHEEMSTYLHNMRAYQHAHG